MRLLLPENDASSYTYAARHGLVFSHIEARRNGWALCFKEIRGNLPVRASNVTFPSVATFMGVAMVPLEEIQRRTSVPTITIEPSCRLQ